MSKSNRLKSSDLLEAERLAWECKELGDDAYAWRIHFFKKLEGLVGAELVLGGEMHGCCSRQLRDLGTVTHGFQNGFNPKGWQESLNRLMTKPDQHLHLQRFCKEYDHSVGSCYERAELISDREWYLSEEYNVVNRVIGIDQCVHCFVPISSRKDDHSGIVLGRSPRRPRFTVREKEITLRVHRFVAMSIGTYLAGFTEPSPSELPRRPREVLKLILEGDSDKQIATRLGLSAYTVNQYVKFIFAHFGVNSRSMLMARWLRRGWCNKATWTQKHQG